MEKLDKEAAVVRVSKWDSAMHKRVLTTPFGENGARAHDLAVEVFEPTGEHA